MIGGGAIMIGGGPYMMGGAYIAAGGDREKEGCEGQTRVLARARQTPKQQLWSIYPHIYGKAKRNIHTSISILSTHGNAKKKKGEIGTRCCDRCEQTLHWHWVHWLWGFGGEWVLEVQVSGLC